ncbi:hypothetical protein IQ249_15520 [Lusitaniella coriacea LEGE 07157]|uniref:Uncharacterized protein n=1 Tax=Lusitaniella coriacea LEGE 07157 TaxID=945747 RepID=A0A8J7DY12_9CYAN|nr:hypothetical protein [Lusitaniella coriacea]MBE9117308.1 hypothetical protein [Lusitaniella coriacea LEGE 07157]
MVDLQSKIRLILSSRIDELNGRRITHKEAEKLKKTFSKLIPNWFINILFDFPLIGCDFELSEDLDISELGVGMQWMSAADTIWESTEAYPGIAAVLVGYLPVGMCTYGSGDPYFLNTKDIALPLVRIPHTALDKNGKLIEEDIELVCSNLSNFFEIVEIEQ